MRGADPVLYFPTIHPAACALLLLATVGPREIAGMKGDERFRTESNLYLVQQFCFDDGVPPSNCVAPADQAEPAIGGHACGLCASLPRKHAARKPHDTPKP
jgi:hypothetical protein